MPLSYDTSPKDFDSICMLLQELVGPGAIVEKNSQNQQPYIQIALGYFITVMETLHATDGLYFDHLACITAVDNGPQAATMELYYNLYSYPCQHALMIQLKMDRNEIINSTCQIPSCAHIWKAADWHEREAFDLMGIKFSGHPNLKRILLPADWEGHPLRKDYEPQTHYHGIQVKY